MTVCLAEGQLLERARLVRKQALALGSLRPIPTRSEILEADGCRWLIRVLEGHDQKAADIRKTVKKKDPNFNPFLPHDPSMEVCVLSESHLCMLNKFPVMDDHLLMITRCYENQAEALSERDMHAVLVCLNQFDGLCFYNGGRTAGASQHHKHLQALKLPLHQACHLPIQPFLDGQGLPFQHAYMGMPHDLWQDPKHGAAELLAFYHRALRRLHLGNGKDRPGAYNFLATRDHIWIVPRSREAFQGLGINSLGFAGSFFVRNDVEKQRLIEIGPAGLLAKVVG